MLHCMQIEHRQKERRSVSFGEKGVYKYPGPWVFLGFLASVVQLCEESPSGAEHSLFLPGLGSACAASLWKLQCCRIMGSIQTTLQLGCSRMMWGSIYFFSHSTLCLLASLSWSWSWCSWWHSSSVFGISAFQPWPERNFLFYDPDPLSKGKLESHSIFSLISVCLNKFWDSCIWSRKFRLANFYRFLKGLKITSALSPAARSPKSGQCLESSKNSNDPWNWFC